MAVKSPTWFANRGRRVVQIRPETGRSRAGIRTLDPARRSPNRIAGDTTLSLGQEDDSVGGTEHK